MCKEIVLFRVQFRSVRMCFIHIERKEIVHGQKIIKITIQDENGFRNVFDSLPLSTAVAMMLFFWDRKFLQGSRLTSTHGLVARLYFFGLTSTS